MVNVKYYLVSACAIISTGYACEGFAAQSPVNKAAMDAPAAASDQTSPYQLNLLYTGEEWGNAMGGIQRGGSYMNNIDARLSVDTDKAFGWTGGRFVLEGWYENKTSTGNSYVGAVDQQSPIDTAWNTDMYRLYQVYYDQKLGDTDILFGIYDLETEFSVTKPMSLFLSKDLTWNTAFDQSGTMPENGSGGPGNYPYTPLALRVRQTLSDHWSVQGVVADGVADNPHKQQDNGVYFSSNYGALGMGEVDYAPDKHTKVMLGTWGMTSQLPANELNADGSTRYIRGQEGAYVGAATRLYTPDSSEQMRGLDAFFTLGYSDPTATNTVQSLNGGLVYTGLLDARPHDKMGVSFNENAASNSFKNAQIASGSGVDSYETSFEATYRAPINEWITVQPDVQYIVDPGYDPTLKNDLIFGVHFEIGHLFNL